VLDIQDEAHFNFRSQSFSLHSAWLGGN